MKWFDVPMSDLELVTFCDVLSVRVFDCMSETLWSMGKLPTASSQGSQRISGIVVNLFVAKLCVPGPSMLGCH